MRPITLVLSLILILMLAFLAFFFAGGTLRAEAVSITANAAEYPDAYASVKSVIESASAPQVFAAEDWGDAATYTLVDINVTLTNRGLFAAEWLNIQLEGAKGDIAVYSLNGDGMDVGARSSQQINLKLITRATAGSKRSLQIQYYVYGISRSITVEV